MARQNKSFLSRTSTVPSPNEGALSSLYEHAARSREVYAHYANGYTEDEIARYFNISLEDVQRDLQYQCAKMNTRVLRAAENERLARLIQRTHSKLYSDRLKDALEIEAKQYLAGGMSPVGPLKEFREAVGMVEKPGAVAVFINNNNGASADNRPRSAEEMMRRVMAKIKEKNAGVEVPAPAEKSDGDAKVVDIEVVLPDGDMY